jgi:hypothetical protein
MKSILKFFCLLVLLTPCVSFAETIPFTSDQTKTYSNMSITSDGYVFEVDDDGYVSDETYNLDASIPAGGIDGAYEIIWSSSYSGCAYDPLVALQWGGAGTVYADGSTASQPAEFVHSTTTFSNTSTASTYWKFYVAGCDVGSTVTIHALYLNDEIIFEYTTGEEEETIEEYVLTPPVLTLQLLATSTCEGSPTSSTCWYEYSESTTTDVVAEALQQLEKDAQFFFLVGLWITAFWFVFFLIKFLIVPRYDNY